MFLSLNNKYILYKDSEELGPTEKSELCPATQSRTYSKQLLDGCSKVFYNYPPTRNSNSLVICIISLFLRSDIHEFIASQHYLMRLDENKTRIVPVCRHSFYWASIFISIFPLVFFSVDSFFLHQKKGNLCSSLSASWWSTPVEDSQTHSVGALRLRVLYSWMLKHSQGWCRAVWESQNYVLNICRCGSSDRGLWSPAGVIYSVT